MAGGEGMTCLRVSGKASQRWWLLGKAPAMGREGAKRISRGRVIQVEERANAKPYGRNESILSEEQRQRRPVWLEHSELRRK